VWFDSGVSHEAVLAARPEDGLRKPADLYLEGSDQHRGWFQSALLTGIGMDRAAPYRQCLTHGFTVDEQGRKQSKSLGNVVAPQQVVDALGADVLRLWIAGADYRNEMSVSDGILKRSADSYRRIRNTARFLLGNLHGFDPAQHLVPHAELLLLDQWAVHRAHELQEQIKDAYARYDFSAVVQVVQNFCTNDLGALYLDVTKDRLYTMREDSRGRRSAQSAMFHVAEAMVRWIAPILSFTADEIWGYLPGERVGNVMFATWYGGLQSVPNDSIVSSADIDYLLAMRQTIVGSIEPKRASGQLGSSLEAVVSIWASENRMALLNRVKDELRFLFISSDVHIAPQSEFPAGVHATTESGFYSQIEISNYSKCIRCWHYRSDVGANPGHPEICLRCASNVDGPGEDRKWF